MNDDEHIMCDDDHIMNDDDHISSDYDHIRLRSRSEGNPSRGVNLNKIRVE